MKIFWTKTAKKHLKNIHSYIAHDSEYYANEFALKLKNAVLRLEQFSKSGRIIPETGNENAREIICGSYRIMYELIDDKVYIAQIVHGATNFTGEARR